MNTVDPLIAQGLNIPWKASAYMSAAYTLPLGSNSWNIIPWDTIFYDPLDSFTVGTGSTYTAPVHGLYVVCAAFAMGSAAAFTGEQQCGLFRNGLLYALGTHMTTTNSGVNPTPAIMTMVPLAALDVIDFRVGSNATAGNAVLGPGLAGNSRSYMHVHWLAPH